MTQIYQNGMLVDFPNQTTKQPVRWQCQNDDCKLRNCYGVLVNFTFEADEPICPKCTARGYPTVQKVILVHLLVRDRLGPIQGATSRYSLACDPKRDYITHPTNGEAATGEIPPVNCPGCMKVIKEQKLGFQGSHIRLDLNIGVA